MLIPFSEVLNTIGPINGILHCGAYDGEEQDIYSKYGINNVLYVEANQLLYERLVQKVGKEKSIHRAVWNKDNETLPFHIYYSFDGTNLGCSSLLKENGLCQEHPAIRSYGQMEVSTITIDTILKDRPDIDFLNMDIQGAELLALEGSTKVLPQLKGILTEFSLRPLYEGACISDQLDKYLSTFGFKRVYTVMATDVWGDCLYVRETN